MKWFLPLCFTLIIFGVVAYLHSGKLLTFTEIKPEEPLLDSSIPLLEGLYSPLPGNVVRGKVHGTITLESFHTPSLVRFCDITQGAIVFISDSEKELRCNEGQTKTSGIDTDKSFTIDLFSGMYFVDIDSLHGVSTLFPARVSVHKGQTFSFTISR